MVGKQLLQQLGQRSGSIEYGTFALDVEQELSLAGITVHTVDID